MPQISLEYSTNVIFEKSFSELFEKSHQIMNEVLGIQVYNCKSRAIRREKFFIGDGKADYGMAHMEVSIFEGRAAELKNELGSKLLELLESSICRDKTEIQVTLEIKEIIKEQYFKKVIKGTDPNE